MKDNKELLEISYLSYGAVISLMFDYNSLSSLETLQYDSEEELKKIQGISKLVTMIHKSKKAMGIGNFLSEKYGIDTIDMKTKNLENKNKEKLQSKLKSSSSALGFLKDKSLLFSRSCFSQNMIFYDFKDIQDLELNYLYCLFRIVPGAEYDQRDKLKNSLNKLKQMSETSSYTPINYKLEKDLLVKYKQEIVSNQENYNVYLQKRMPIHFEDSVQFVHLITGKFLSFKKETKDLNTYLSLTDQPGKNTIFRIKPGYSYQTETTNIVPYNMSITIACGDIVSNREKFLANSKYTLNQHYYDMLEKINKKNEENDDNNSSSTTTNDRKRNKISYKNTSNKNSIKLYNEDKEKTDRASSHDNNNFHINLNSDRIINNKLPLKNVKNNNNNNNNSNSRLSKSHQKLSPLKHSVSSFDNNNNNKNNNNNNTYLENNLSDDKSSKIKLMTPEMNTRDLVNLKSKKTNSQILNIKQYKEKNSSNSTDKVKFKMSSNFNSNNFMNYNNNNNSDISYNTYNKNSDELKYNNKLSSQKKVISESLLIHNNNNKDTSELNREQDSKKSPNTYLTHRSSKNTSEIISVSYNNRSKSTHPNYNKNLEHFKHQHLEDNIYEEEIFPDELQAKKLKEQIQREHKKYENIVICDEKSFNKWRFLKFSDNFEEEEQFLNNTDMFWLQNCEKDVYVNVIEVEKNYKLEEDFKTKNKISNFIRDLEQQQYDKGNDTDDYNNNNDNEPYTGKTGKERGVIKNLMDKLPTNTNFKQNSNMKEEFPVLDNPNTKKIKFQSGKIGKINYYNSLLGTNKKTSNLTRNIFNKNKRNKSNDNNGNEGDSDNENKTNKSKNVFRDKLLQHKKNRSYNTNISSAYYNNLNFLKKIGVNTINSNDKEILVSFDHLKLNFSNELSPSYSNIDQNGFNNPFGIFKLEPVLKDGLNAGHYHNNPNIINNSNYHVSIPPNNGPLTYKMYFKIRNIFSDQLISIDNSKPSKPKLILVKQNKEKIENCLFVLEPIFDKKESKRSRDGILVQKSDMVRIKSKINNTYIAIKLSSNSNNDFNTTKGHNLILTENLSDLTIFKFDFLNFEDKKEGNFFYQLNIVLNYFIEYFSRPKSIMIREIKKLDNLINNSNNRNNRNSIKMDIFNFNSNLNKEANKEHTSYNFNTNYNTSTDLNNNNNSTTKNLININNTEDLNINNIDNNNSENLANYVNNLNLFRQVEEIIYLEKFVSILDMFLRLLQNYKQNINSSEGSSFFHKAKKIDILTNIKEFKVVYKLLKLVLMMWFKIHEDEKEGKIIIKDHSYKNDYKILSSKVKDSIELSEVIVAKINCSDKFFNILWIIFDIDYTALHIIQPHVYHLFKFVGRINSCTRFLIHYLGNNNSILLMLMTGFENGNGKNSIKHNFQEMLNNNHQMYSLNSETLYLFYDLLNLFSICKDEPFGPFYKNIAIGMKLLVNEDVLSAIVAKSTKSRREIESDKQKKLFISIKNENRDSIDESNEEQEESEHSNTKKNSDKINSNDGKNTLLAHLDKHSKYKEIKKRHKEISSGNININTNSNVSSKHNLKLNLESISITNNIIPKSKVTGITNNYNQNTTETSKQTRLKPNLDYWMMVDFKLIDGRIYFIKRFFLIDSLNCTIESEEIQEQSKLLYSAKQSYNEFDMHTINSNSNTYNTPHTNKTNNTNNSISENNNNFIIKNNNDLNHIEELNSFQERKSENKDTMQSYFTINNSKEVTNPYNDNNELYSKQLTRKVDYLVDADDSKYLNNRDIRKYTTSPYSYNYNHYNNINTNIERKLTVNTNNTQNSGKNKSKFSTYNYKHTNNYSNKISKNNTRKNTNINISFKNPFPTEAKQFKDIVVEINFSNFKSEVLNNNLQNNQAMISKEFLETIVANNIVLLSNISLHDETCRKNLMKVFKFEIVNEYLAKDRVNSIIISSESQSSDGNNEEESEYKITEEIKCSLIRMINYLYLKKTPVNLEYFNLCRKINLKGVNNQSNSNSNSNSEGIDNNTHSNNINNLKGKDDNSEREFLGKKGNCNKESIKLNDIQLKNKNISNADNSHNYHDNTGSLVKKEVNISHIIESEVFKIIKNIEHKLKNHIQGTKLLTIGFLNKISETCLFIIRYVYSKQIEHGVYHTINKSVIFSYMSLLLIILESTIHKDLTEKDIDEDKEDLYKILNLEEFDRKSAFNNSETQGNNNYDAIINLTSTFNSYQSINQPYIKHYYSFKKEFLKLVNLVEHSNVRVINSNKGELLYKSTKTNLQSSNKNINNNALNNNMPFSKLNIINTNKKDSYEPDYLKNISFLLKNQKRRNTIINTNQSDNNNNINVDNNIDKLFKISDNNNIHNKENLDKPDIENNTTNEKEYNVKTMELVSRICQIFKEFLNFVEIDNVTNIENSLIEISSNLMDQENTNNDYNINNLKSENNGNNSNNDNLLFSKNQKNNNNKSDDDSYTKEENKLNEIIKKKIFKFNNNNKLPYMGLLGELSSYLFHVKRKLKISNLNSNITYIFYECMEKIESLDMKTTIFEVIYKLSNQKKIFFENISNLLILTNDVEIKKFESLKMILAHINNFLYTFNSIHFRDSSLRPLLVNMRRLFKNIIKITFGNLSEMPLILELLDDRNKGVFSARSYSNREGTDRGQFNNNTYSNKNNGDGDYNNNSIHNSNFIVSTRSNKNDLDYYNESGGMTSKRHDYSSNNDKYGSELLITPTSKRRDTSFSKKYLLCKLT